MLAPNWIVGFSGHRQVPDRGAAVAGFQAVLGELAERIRTAGGAPAFHSSVASGADLLALEAAEAAGYSIHLILPLPVDEFRSDFENPDEWAQAESWIAKAATGDRGWTLSVPTSVTPRPNCYYEAGARMITASDLLVAFWDGQAAKGLGGTSDVVELARHQGKPVIRVVPESGQLAEGDSPQLPSEWPGRDPVVDRLNRILSEESKKPALNASDLQFAFDYAANQRAPQFRRGVARAIWIHTLAALVGTVPSLFYFAFVPEGKGRTSSEYGRWENWAEIFTAIELALVLVALVVTLILYWGKTQQRWLTTRFASEVIRSLRASRPWLDPLHPQVERHFPEWRRFAVTVGILAGPDAAIGAPLEERKKAYLDGRIAEQRGHFQQKAGPAERAHHRWHLVAKWAAILAPFAVAFALADKIFHVHLTDFWWGAFCGKFLPVALPLIAASATAMRNALDLTRRAKRYPEVEVRLAALAAMLEATKTFSTSEAVVVRTEEILLDELIEWHLAAANAGAH
jgi:hypothetical protein